MWLGVDDTDSRNGGCTTHLALELLYEIQGSTSLDLLGSPRLVRLNPNIPWKTRGNGAVSFHLGKGCGRGRKIGTTRGEDLLSHYEDRDRGNEKGVMEGLFDLCRSVVMEWARLEDPSTDPGLVLCERKPGPQVYMRAVHEVVGLEDVKTEIQKECDSGNGIVTFTPKEGRGLIGAFAAASWEPNDRTYEIIAYRNKERWGTRREVDPPSVEEMERAFPSTFDSRDQKNKDLVFAPSSPCPVLLGIRGDDPLVLPDALSTVRSEPYEGWLVFETNQGTDDHIKDVKLHDIQPYLSVRARGVVQDMPRTIKGGHVLFPITDGGSTVDCAAYEPTKEFREVVRQLMPGDGLEVFGGIRRSPLTINIEKFRVISLASHEKKVGNPICPGCNRPMSSIGRDAGYRCRRCKTRAQEEDAKVTPIERSLAQGWYEVPSCARRHLSKPLKRLGLEKRRKTPREVKE